MQDQSTLAYVNLNAVLRNLEDLVALDPEAARIVAGRKETVSFIVGDGPRGSLSLGPSACRFTAGKTPSTIALWFPKPASLNAMVAGTGNPIPLKGLTRLGFLTGPFSELAKRLGAVLKADAAARTDAKLAKTNAELLLYTATFALAEVGNHDPVGKLNAARIPDGIIEIGIEGGPAVSITAKSGRLSAAKGRTGKARAAMTFESMEAARALFNGEVDAMEALGEGKVGMKGFIPMLEHMNKVLGLVPRYLG
jgi:hypothetical protein